MIRSISIRDFRQKMADTLNRVAYRGDHIALTRRDEIVAVLVPYDDLKELRKLRQEAGGVTSSFDEIANYVVDKNEKLYRKLAE